MKKKYVLGLFSCLGAFMLASCSTGISSIESENNIYPTNAIRKMIYLKEGSDLEQLYVMGDGGNCATYDFTDDVWYEYSSNTERQNCATVSHIMDAIYDAYFVTVNGKTVLVVAGSNGEIASCKIKDNAWVMPNGQRYYVKKAAPTIYNDGSYRDNKDI